MKQADNSDKEIKRDNSYQNEEEPILLPGQNSSIAPFTDGDGGEYLPRHLADIGVQHPDKGAYLSRPDGSHIAANGAVIREPWSEQPEITPDHEYTPEKEDLNLLIL